MDPGSWPGMTATVPLGSNSPVIAGNDPQSIVVLR
jgi:hypothetical protein